MASLYRRERSPFWWIEYIDTAGERRQESTNLRHALPGESRKAIQLRDELTTRELAARSSESANRIELWASWVPRFISQRYSGSPLTLDRCTQAWHNLNAFLQTQRIMVPRQLTRQQVRDYVEWRQIGDRENRVHKAAKNTALLEVKFLSLIMDEAVQSGFCTANPCRRLGFKRDEPKPKPKITTAEHRLIIRSLKNEPDWMRVAYRIAWEQGCRFSETCFPLNQVDLAGNVLGLRTKGKKKSVAEVPLSPRLRPMLRRLIGQKRETTFQMPVDRLGRSVAGKAWFNFFRKIGLGHLSFQCTRVTFITRCYEAGLSEPDVMRLCLHASTTVHRIYPRLPAASKYLQELMQRVAS